MIFIKSKCAQFSEDKNSSSTFIFFTKDIMSKKLFIGNIDWGTTDEQLGELFSKYGAVEEAIIVKDKFSNRSKGFGFVTFTDGAEADKATEELNGYELNGRALVVNEARPPKPRE